MVRWPSMKVIEAYRIYEKYGTAERNYARETIVKLRDCFGCWILPVLGGLEIESVREIDIATLRAAMVDRELSIARQYAVIMWVKTFLKFCREVLLAQVLDPGKIRLPRRPVPQVQFLSPDEVQVLRGAVAIHTLTGKRMRALIELLLGTGVRLGEALSLTREVFDQCRREMEIVGKGGKRRKIFFTDEVYRWVHLYLQARTDHEAALFVTTSGVPPRCVARADVSKMFIALRKAAGMKKAVTPHMLRHTYCTSLLNHGVDIRFIRDLAGHQDIQTTARYYLGVDDAKLREIVETKVKYEAPASA